MIRKTQTSVRQSREMQCSKPRR